MEKMSKVTMILALGTISVLRIEKTESENGDEQPSYEIMEYSLEQEIISTSCFAKTARFL
uniref:Uncharacterized protein n=1 Tax=Vitis vinifera TaxID=29760 RepID=F6HSE4_VITVI